MAVKQRRNRLIGIIAEVCRKLLKAVVGFHILRSAYGDRRYSLGHMVGSFVRRNHAE